MGPNFREPCTINFSKTLTEIKTDLDSCIDKMANKTKKEASNFSAWKESVLTAVKQKIELLKNKYHPMKTYPVLQDPEVLSYLENLQQHYVIVPIDKAANNFAFICKKFYVSRLLTEVGIHTFVASDTYSQVNDTKENIINENVKQCKKSRS